MTATREAIVLPLLFLTALAIAAIRPGAAASMSPPSPAALVAGMALFALLVRSGSLAPARLMNGSRSALANVNGLLVLLTLFIASAQVVAAIVPESGVPSVIAWMVLLSLLLQAFAMTSDRTRVLRGLLVTFGAAFIVKYVVLAALSTPAQGRIGRAVQTLFEGVTLGVVSQRPLHAAEPYLTFAALVLYLVGLALLPAADWQMIRVGRRQISGSENVAGL
jgi:hypothetical protein